MFLNNLHKVCLYCSLHCMSFSRFVSRSFNNFFALIFVVCVKCTVSYIVEIINFVGKLYELVLVWLCSIFQLLNFLFTVYLTKSVHFNK